MTALRAFACLLLCCLSTAAARAEDSCLSAHENAQRSRRDGHFIEARQQLLLCAQAECPRVVRNDCTGWADEVEASTPSLVFAVKSSRGGDLSHVRVSANGKVIAEQLDGRAIAVDPGVYELRFEADGHEPLSETISVREAEKSRFVRVALQAEPPTLVAPQPSEPERVWPVSAIVLGGVAVAAGASALGLGLWGKREYDRLHDRCGRSCDDSEVATGKRAYIAADVMAGVAAASAIGALWIFIHDNRERAPVVSALPTRGGVSLSLSRAF
jgi:hypothetical protein